MNAVFVSNYINHHQIPFCEAMEEVTGRNFLFIQTEQMEKERLRMGWKEETPSLGGAGAGRKGHPLL